MYRVTVECEGVAGHVGSEGAADIEQEFRAHRTWHERPLCTFTDGALTLIVENDFDRDGRATLDEFCDCLVAYIGEHGSARIVSVEMPSDRDTRS